MKIEIITFPEYGDDRGTLIVLEQNKKIPFDIKRIYYMFDTQEGIRRGFHAHKKTRQLAIPVKGQCKILLDDGFEKAEVCLKDPGRGVMIEPMIWHEMYDYSEDCVLLVLADDFYDESDYIRDYNAFMTEIKK
jgi:dTDP-4-dehydrorhamnose 3,5-epimerase-like enzyme